MMLDLAFLSDSLWSTSDFDSSVIDLFDDCCRFIRTEALLIIWFSYSYYCRRSLAFTFLSLLRISFAMCILYDWKSLWNLPQHHRFLNLLLSYYFRLFNGRLPLFCSKGLFSSLKSFTNFSVMVSTYMFFCSYVF